MLLSCKNCGRGAHHINNACIECGNSGTPSGNELTADMIKLRDAAKWVFDLLDDPEMGQSDWNELLRSSCIHTQSALCSLGCTPEACGIKYRDA